MLRRAVARIKPRHGGKIDWGDSITKGLVFCCSFSEPLPRDLVTGIRASANAGVTNRHSPDGPAAAITAAAVQYYNFPHDARWNTLGRSTILWRGLLLSGARHHGLVSKRAANGPINNPLDFVVDATANQLRSIKANAGGFRGWLGQVVSLNAWHTGAVVWADENIQNAPIFMLDGQFVTGTADTSGGTGTGVATGNTNPLRVGQDETGGFTRFDGNTSLICVWNRALSRTELMRLARSPFCFLRPARARNGRKTLGAFLYTLAKASWGATASSTAAVKLTLGQATWAAAGNALSYNAHALVTLAKATWAAAGNALTYNTHALVTLGTAAWSATGPALSYNAHYLATLAKATWAWAGNALTYSFGGPTLITLGRAGWGWIGSLTTSGAGASGSDTWRSIRSTVRAVVRSVTRTS